MNSIEFQLPLNSVPPYTIYVCDGFGNNCVFIALLQDNNPTTPFFLPTNFNNAPMIIVKVIDGINCVTEKTYFCGLSDSEGELAVNENSGFLTLDEGFYIRFI